MRPRLRKAALTAHVSASVGWFGAVAGFLALAITGLASTDADQVRAAYLTMEPLTRLVIVPLALASLLTGLVSSLASPWGLFRHYWVVVKLVVTVFAAAVLLAQVGPIARLADEAGEGPLSSTDQREQRVSLAAHAGGGLGVLLVPTVLGVYKPRGVTRYGQRKQRQERTTTPP